MANGLTRHVFELFAVGGKGIVFEFQRRPGACCRSEALAEAQGAGERHDRRRYAAQQGRHLQPPHRACEDGRLDGQAVVERAQPDATAHRVSDQEPWFRQVQWREGGEEGRYVLAVFVEGRDMAHVATMCRTVGKALAAPVEGHHAVAFCCKVGGEAAIFFDIFGATRKHQDRAARPFRPDRHAQTGAIERRDPIGLHIGRPFGHRIEERSVSHVVNQGRFVAHQPRAEASFIAVPISPSSVSLPDMNADVGFISPDMISWKTSDSAERVTSALSLSAASRTSLPSTMTVPSPRISNLAVPSKSAPAIFSFNAATAASIVALLMECSPLPFPCTILSS
mmetsp:Transcript_3558/g.6438  ORF Transcript_3558/g.6438 Transcript_3558/m.6438 type:complete len:338 (+) Transcript_3558:886-1899(+)